MNKPSAKPTPPERRTATRQPPRWAVSLLSWLTPADLLEELPGGWSES